MCGANVAEAASGLKKMCRAWAKSRSSVIKAQKNMPFNVILHVDMMGYSTVKKFIQTFEAAKAESLAAQKQKLDEKKE